MPVPRGRLLGGSSSINGMVFVRGQAQDYDGWAQLGNRGWSYRDVLPLFRAMESYGSGEDEYRGREGPLKVSDTYEHGPLYDALIAASAEAGIQRNPDYNGAVQDGIGMTQTTISGGRRMSTARCYLDPARSRPNLEIRTETLAEALLLEEGRCTGVRYRQGDVSREVRAAREVVVSAGSIASPQLLELSGIGNGERLRDIGIDVRHELPGVGENLRDHYAPRMKWRVTAPGLTYNDKARGPGMVWQALKYAFGSRGLLGIPASSIRAYVRTREGLASPDAMISWIPFLVAENFKLARQSGLTVITHPLRSESTGSVHRGFGRSGPSARDPVQFPVGRDRPTDHVGGHADRTPHHGRRAARGHHRGGDRPRLRLGERRRAAQLGQGDGRDHIPSGRHMQDGFRSHGGGGRYVARAGA